MHVVRLINSIVRRVWEIAWIPCGFDPSQGPRARVRCFSRWGRAICIRRWCNHWMRPRRRARCLGPGRYCVWWSSCRCARTRRSLDCGLRNAGGDRRPIVKIIIVASWGGRRGGDNLESGWWKPVGMRSVFICDSRVACCWCKLCCCWNCGCSCCCGWRKLRSHSTGVTDKKCASGWEPRVAVEYYSNPYANWGRGQGFSLAGRESIGCTYSGNVNGVVVMYL